MAVFNLRASNWKRYLMYGVAALLVAVIQPWLDGSAMHGLMPQVESDLRQAWQERRSEVWVNTDARVIKTLPDDIDGDRHQRFLVDAGTGRSILVAHNIDLADRVPLKSGTLVRIAGRYEWNDRGGVIHWTHHDPSGRIDGGWIELGGHRYR